MTDCSKLRRDKDALSEATILVVPERATRDATMLTARKAEHARAAGDDGADHDSIAWFEIVHAVADSADEASHLVSRNNSWLGVLLS